MGIIEAPAVSDEGEVNAGNREKEPALYWRLGARPGARPGLKKA